MLFFALFMVLPVCGLFYIHVRFRKNLARDFQMVAGDRWKLFCLLELNTFVFVGCHVFYVIVTYQFWSTETTVVNGIALLVEIVVFIFNAWGRR